VRASVKTILEAQEANTRRKILDGFRRSRLRRIATRQDLRQHDLNIEFNVMIVSKDIRSLTDFRRNTKTHLRRLKQTGRPEVLTVNGKAELIVQNAAAYEEMIDAIRGIQRGLDSMAAGQGEPARKVLDRIRDKYKIPKASR
jgi:PHD/YefM family antitoxin component YafN of YafNO toxin-antitoxin module